MNRISLYTLLILIFLGLSKSFAPSEHKTPKIDNELVFPNYFLGSPLSSILVDAFQTGFLIKTYFLKFKQVDFYGSRYVVVRTSKDFWRKSTQYMGMSLFRRNQRDGSVSSVPLPPGSIYIGNVAYGLWEYMDSGERKWKFFGAYSSYPEIFGWGKWRPSKSFYEKMEKHLFNGTPFLGLNKEFGIDGKITRKAFPDFFKKEPAFNIDMKKHFSKYLWFPNWKDKPLF